MTLDQRLRPAVDEMHEFASTLRVPVLEPDHRPLAPRRRKPAFALAAAAMLVIIIGLTALLAPFGGGEAPIVDEMTPAPAPTKAPSPSPDQSVPAEPETETVTTVVIANPPGQASITWTRIDDPSIFGELETGIHSLAVTEHGLFAGGYDGDDAAIWLSIDGISWQRVDDPAGVFGSGQSPFGDAGHRGIIGFASRGGITIAVGEDANVPREEVGFTISQITVAAVWYTDDGLEWHRVEHDPDVFGTQGWNGMGSVMADDDGFLAVGRSVFRSADGIVWERSRDSTDVDMIDVIATDDGLIAVGWYSLGVPVPAIWYSADGVTWRQADVEGASSPGEGFCQMLSVVRTDSGFVAVGCLSMSSQDGAAWWSADGVTWELTHTPPAGRLERLNAVAADGQMLVAGGDESARSVIDEEAIVRTTGLIWISVDGGRTWDVQPDNPMFGNIYSDNLSGYVAAITFFDGRIVAAGPYADHAAIWIGEWDE